MMNNNKLDPRSGVWTSEIRFLHLSGSHQNSNNLLWVVDHNSTDQLQGSRQKDVWEKKKCTWGTKLSLVWMCLFEENPTSGATLLFKIIFRALLLSRMVLTSVNGKKKKKPLTVYFTNILRLRWNINDILWVYDWVKKCSTKLGLI